MLNIENYKDEIKGYIANGSSLNCALYKVRTGKAKCTDDEICEDCYLENLNWLCEEYVEQVDWSKVEKGTLIEVRDRYTEDWKPRRFYRYDDYFFNPFIVYQDDVYNRECNVFYGYKFARLIKKGE